jgi:hypothetical protein
MDSKIMQIMAILPNIINKISMISIKVNTTNKMETISSNQLGKA